ncbi:MAG TPA: hypothetical protein VF574_03335 [Allosphingosinicella sp.]|jgi:autotransporter adhesin
MTRPTLRTAALFAAALAAGGGTAGAQSTCSLNSAEAAGPAVASGPGALACGPAASASQPGTTAVGAGASASGQNATAIGRGASATALNSVAVGQGSFAGQANTFSVGSGGGERRIVNVAAGTGPTDAVNLAQLNAAIAGAAVDLSPLQSQVDALSALRLNDREDAQRGIAAAVAMSAPPMPSEPGRVSYTLNGSIYRGEKAVGGSMMYRLNTSAPMAFGAGISHAGGGSTAVRVGVAGEF